jgi:hypothetical protein
LIVPRHGVQMGRDEQANGPPGQGWPQGVVPVQKGAEVRGPLDGRRTGTGACGHRDATRWAGSYFPPTIKAVPIPKKSGEPQTKHTPQSRPVKEGPYPLSKRRSRRFAERRRLRSEVLVDDPADDVRGHDLHRAEESQDGALLRGRKTFEGSPLLQGFA